MHRPVLDDVSDAETEEEREGKLNMVPFPPPITEQVKRICVTGGPHGGKTTAMSQVAERLRSMGLQVFLTPEHSTLLTTAGVRVPSPDEQQYLESYEVGKLRMQITMESAFIRIAEASRRATVILFDRGCLDDVAYCSEERWKGILASLKTSDEELLRRYDAVVHMVTTAQGAESYYCLQHGADTVQEAVNFDQKIRKAWEAHPRHRIIENPPGGMEEKVQQVVAEICQLLGVQSPTLNKTQFTINPGLVAKMETPEWEWVHAFLDEFLVEITFLEGSGAQSNSYLRRRVRKENRLGDADSYAYCSKLCGPSSPPMTPLWLPLCKSEQGASSEPGLVSPRQSSSDSDRQQPAIPSPTTPPKMTQNGRTLISKEHPLTRREYDHLLRTQGMSSCSTLHIFRRCFCYKNHWFQLDHYRDVNVTLLEVETPRKDGDFPLPKWLRPYVEKKTTGTPEELKYQPYHLAKSVPENTPLRARSLSVEEE